MTSIKAYDPNYVYINRTAADAETGFWVASAASGAVMSLMPFLTKPFEKQIVKEQINNSEYKEALLKAYNNSGLNKKGLNIVDASKTIVFDSSVTEGKQAYFAVADSGTEVVLNLEKSSSAGFHEFGHALNHYGNKFIKYLQKMRGGCYTLAGLMGTVVLFSRRKPKEAKKNIVDYIQDNAGLIAFSAMLPVVAEEALASYKGLKLARNAGLSKNLMGNLKKLYSKALLTYAGRATLVGISVQAAGKIMDHYTRPQKVPRNQYFIS